MATYSTDELAHKVLAMYERGQTRQAGQVLSRQDLLEKWPKGFTPTELEAALDHACDHGWLELTETGFRLTEGGLVEQ
ncbi:MAG: hypothetical protein QM771_20415 [Nitrospira sp.]